MRAFTRTAQRSVAVCGTLTAGLVLACGSPGSGATPPPEDLRADVLETLPHDPTAFTQGFEIAHGTLYESTGLVGESDIRATDLGTGTELARAELAAPLFAEGLTVVDDRIWQLTWKSEVAIERDRETLEELRRVGYEGEGWGLCYQRRHDRLVMSDGSDRLTFRDPDSFAPLDDVAVTSAGEAVERLNELECVGEDVYANVWRSDTIVRIDPADGAVTAEIDASGLLDPQDEDEAGVLNGIASVPGTDRFLLTGKNWPASFRVRFVPAAS
ncbi:glutaminyl-peptide cyclotransferase [Haloechinothrix sp. YIM 98757]|uniref:Glutaminyl-peptide cyclotransferase n=1 Tax=Haloechinothrix aidingensis TaxID=2752311 RepID=A0A838AEW9_9PSEU|nr:glutaminyl-peptide cyclotransferase [Haloechinothrix aidingensis]